MLFMRGKKVAVSLSTRKNSSETNHQLLTNVQLLVRAARISVLSPVNPGRPLTQQLERLL
jgi:hypothetical protein